MGVFFGIAGEALLIAGIYSEGKREFFLGEGTDDCL